MLKTYAYPRFAYAKPPELSGGATRRYSAIIVGAGPVGLTAAIDCRLHGIPALVLDEDDTVSVGSRGVCYAKRTLEVLDRLGVGDAVVDKGVSWNVGRTFFREEEVYRFDLLADSAQAPTQKRPGMINLQQYYLEQFLVRRCHEFGVELRWKSRVMVVRPAADGVTVGVETPDGCYYLHTDWLIVADGARSSIRHMMGLDAEGRIFTDRFLIADVVIKADLPTERWFWFDPPFHPDQSVLLHRQADNVWRIDFQLGWNADPEQEKKPERVIPRIKAMFGALRSGAGSEEAAAPEFDLEWVSVYTFQCRRMAKFRHGRVLFAGDAAHQVSPFGARGANSGIQDSDNLVWKLSLVIKGLAPERLLDTYSDERTFAADENIVNSTRATDFITPRSANSRAYRAAVLQLAREHAFARKLVNSGRLSVPAIYVDSTLNTPDADTFAGDTVPGAPMVDAPVEVNGKRSWLLSQVGNRFELLVFADDPKRVDLSLLARLKDGATPIEPILVVRNAGHANHVRVLVDVQGLAARRYDARSGTVYLIRPDQHVAARWRIFDAGAVQSALERATCND